MQIRLGRQPGRNALDVTAKHGREISVDHRRIPAPDQLDERCYFMADRYLSEANFTRNRREPRFVMRCAAIRA